MTVAIRALSFDLDDTLIDQSIEIAVGRNEVWRPSDESPQRFQSTLTRLMRMAKRKLPHGSNQRCSTALIFSAARNSATPLASSALLRQVCGYE